LALAVTAANAHSSDAKLPPLRTADWVDLSRYLGTWYVISTIPEDFGYKSLGIHTTYTAEKDHILIDIKWRRDSFDGAIMEYAGKAYPSKESNARWKFEVSKPKQLVSDYWIIELDKDYNWAIVSGP
jgi:apolipoprotein D and lipocalin family protein